MAKTESKFNLSSEDLQKFRDLGIAGPFRLLAEPEIEPVLRKLRTAKTKLLDIIANNPIDQKVVELCPSQHYSLVEHSMYRSVFPPQGVENGVFLPASPRASKAFAGHDESEACGISAIARTFSVCLGSVCATTLC
jgi:hypothetical protein